jgi:HPt (histidine-containing phosphotransfer) domain-containing protein
MIDREQFKQRYRDFDKDLVLDILDLFINDYNEKISRLSKDLSGHQPEALKNDAHALKGIIGNIDTSSPAFEYITQLEDLAQQLIEAIPNDKGMTPETEKAKYDEMMRLFMLFKNTSHQLLNDAKELKKDYSE